MRPKRYGVGVAAEPVQYRGKQDPAKFCSRNYAGVIQG